MNKPNRRSALPIALVLAAATAACGGDITLPDEGNAANIVIVSGNGQFGPAGGALSDQVVVKVTDAEERAVPNQEVTFLIGSGGGAVAPTTVTTDGTGQAAAGWTLGPATGSQSLVARTPKGGSTDMLEVAFGATALAGSGSNLLEVSGDEQTGAVSSALGEPLVVIATDALGNPVANVTVTWSVSGGGSTDPVTVVTGVDGLAAVQRILGPTAGPQSAQAEVDGFAGSPVPFTHTAIPANPTALVKISGDGQRAPGGFEVAEDLVVRLQDENGNGIGGRQITWVLPAGAGSVAPQTSVTAPDGNATTRWTLPSTVGTYTVSAVFSGLPPVSFSATATADAPTTIELVSGNNQSAAVGGTLASPLVVRVTDASDNPVANVAVVWTAEDGGSVSDATTATNASGLAQVTRTLGLLPGSYGTRATVDGLNGSPVVFNSTATVGPPARLAIVTQPGSPTASGSSFVPAPVIQVQDAQGIPVSQGGIEIIATISSGQTGAGLSGNTDPNTNGSGRATFNGLIITGPPDDDYVVTFSSGALLPVSSGPLTVTTGSASQLQIVTQPSPTAVNGAAFAQQPVVQLQDGSGNPVPTAGVVITASILVGSPSLGPPGSLTATTDATGTATFAGLTITGATGTRRLSFARPGLSGVGSTPIEITAGPATTIAIGAGDGQTAQAGTPVATDPAVRVTDISGNPVSGVNVTFQVTGGGGSVTPASRVTGADGVATVDSWTLGTTPGPNSLQASTPFGSVTFSATGQSAAPSQIVILTQPSATAASGSAFAQQPVVQIQDASGNPVPTAGVSITAAIQSGGPTLGPAGSLTVTTDGSGTATFAGLTITGLVGSRTLSFSASGLTTAVSNAISITAGPATSIAIAAGDGQSALAGTAVATDPAVRVTDASGNPVSGVTVDFLVTGGGGSVTPASGLTGADGVSAVDSWTLGPSAGPNALQAGASVGSVTFNATGTSASTTTGLSANPTSSSSGQPVDFTALVQSGAGSPTGQVSFRDNGTEIGQGTLSGGAATFTTSLLVGGTHPITAHYLGDGTFAPSASTTLSYSVVTANRAPSAAPDAFAVDEDETLTIPPEGVLANDTDDDGDLLTAQLVSSPSQPENFALNSDGSFSYTPRDDFTGTDSFTYQASDGQATSGQVQVAITVGEADD